MIWRYYIPHLWEQERQAWEDVYLLPDNKEYDADAIWLTIDAVGFYDEQQRLEAEQKLGGRAYHIDGTDMIVQAEDFTKPELLEWVSLWLAQHDLPVTALVESEYEAFQGRVPDLDSAFAAFEQVKAADERVQVDPDTCETIGPATQTGHPYKLVMAKELLTQIEAMDEHEAEELIRAIAKLADNPTPPGARRLS
jgi:hypothetical protein